jgi:hypothetical protein
MYVTSFKEDKFVLLRLVGVRAKGGKERRKSGVCLSVCRPVSSVSRPETRFCLNLASGKYLQTFLGNFFFFAPAYVRDKENALLFCPVFP